MNADAQFFYANAGFSYDPLKETSEQGRTRGAENLAAAESFGRAAGLCFVWSTDPDTSSGDWSDEGDDYTVWQCLCYDSTGRVCQSIGGVDFGAGGTPWGDNYRRVIEAELAAEHMVETIKAAT